MSWIYEKSSLWRRIVSVTKQSPLAMAGFTAAVFAGSWYAGKIVMQVRTVVWRRINRAQCCNEAHGKWASFAADLVSPSI